MKKSGLVLCTPAIVLFLACNKPSSGAGVALAPSTTVTNVGKEMTILLTTTANTSRWTVHPAADVSKAYGITTSKTNRFIFSKPGTYIISVRIRNTPCNSLLNPTLDSCWARNTAGSGNAILHSDSAFTVVTVVP